MDEIESARACWPGIDVPADEFAAYVAERTPTAAHLGDVYLACACARGDASAIAEFHRVVANNLAPAVARIRNDATFIDEVRQAVCNKLLIAEDGRRKIADYAGRGSLLGWARSVAARLALDLVAGERKHGELDQADAVAASRDPELDFIQDQYRVEFKRAFAAALATLPAEQRNAVRMHYLDGLNLAQIGRLGGVHESTVSRWLAAARDRLLQEIRRELGSRLRLKKDELDSMMRLTSSRLEISLHSLLSVDAG